VRKESIGVNSRRVARELALKVLFQVDVGKQPLGEVLEGALEQVRATVGNPVTQVLLDAQTALRRLAAERSEGVSPQNARKIKQAAASLVSELRRLAEQIAAHTHSVITEKPEATLTDVEARAHAAMEETRVGLRRVAARDSLYPEHMDALADLAERRAHQIEAAFLKHIRAAAQTAVFTVQLVRGATECHGAIDARLAALSAGWRLERQAAVDRNIMRIAAYEILYLPDIPTGATINEAVELAKKYSTAESGRFVNGVLGALANKVES
jgi:N utilization substance protein B